MLGAAALLAILAANSKLSWAYFDLVQAPFTIQFGAFRETLSLDEWVKQGLMSIFFLVVGLELKFEVLKGELANPRRLAVPILAAIAGMAVPALIYLMVTSGTVRPPGAWATPTATDIAFALAALAAASKRAPTSLRVFLLALAMTDDLGAVGLIAILFSHNLQPAHLIAVAITLAALAGLGRWRAAPSAAYGLGFLLVWAFTLKSGVPTSATAFLAALTVPVGSHRRWRDGMLQHLIQSLHPYVAFLILPLFAFFAAGFVLSGSALAQLGKPAIFGVFLGLFLGKQLGVFTLAFLAAVTKLGRKPTGATWVEMYGVSLLCGVGFTMSLYISALAFPSADPEAQAGVRLAVALASVLSGALGMAVLAWSATRRVESQAGEQP